MTEVFVIHGVKNRDQDKFEETVKRLEQTTVGLDLVPIFWGNLGAANDHLDLVIPTPASEADVRDTSSRNPAGAASDPLVQALLGADEADPTTETRGDTVGPNERRDVIAEAAGAGPSELTEDQWRTLLKQAWSELPYLSSIGDPTALRELGEGLGSSSPPASATTGGEDVRGPIDWARQRLRDMEAAASAVIGAAGGRVNHLLRNQIGPDFALFAGDIAVYQRRQTDIQQRIWDTLDRYGAGTAENPARIIAHSLGGVITLDMATNAERPLHINGLVTFGSQWPLLQLIDPRPGIGPYVDTPIVLPDTMSGRWLNLWEPLDPLAFTAAHTLKLSSGKPPNPDDRQAAYRSSSGLWTHSSYWTSQELLAAIRDAFTS
jgi:pimeloyl-ACP methyl ester carboxylesterase